MAFYIGKMNTSDLHEYHVKRSLFGRSRKLTITPEYIEYEDKDRVDDLYTRIEKACFNDVKYAGEWIVWYKFPVGYVHTISILYEQRQILTIRIAGYFGRKKQYGQIYSDISRWIGNYFLVEKVNQQLAVLQAGDVLRFQELTVANEGVSFKASGHSPVIEWENVKLKEYYHYFAMVDKNSPDTHQRFRFDEWKAEVFFNVVKTLVAKVNEER